MRSRASRQRQRGIALFVVFVVVLLTTLLVLGSSRIALINEMATGIDSDHQRTFEAAQAMLRDAESDIRGLQADGSPCVGPGCRAWSVLDAAGGRAFYPTDAGELSDLQAALGGRSPSCAAGICVPDRVMAQFWTDAAALAAMKKVAASHGAYTGGETAGGGHPLLASGAAQRAWYWVELLPYDTAVATRGGSAEALAPDSETPFVYRITAIAQGHRAATQTVLQTTLVWKRHRS
ncbi:pilus assembly protein [Variovorax sp. J31P207]|uniref:pilus assembly PilX family protein n=1 Tax=Variovorax sp. J31P207 TaxID=3053510 RepID=UPI0025783C82|nr:pilus assembly protein [Variovorax sp. J31P207]MDM0068017.1 pilus assembly protein [Variovorax sp. J31P207]